MQRATWLQDALVSVALTVAAFVRSLWSGDLEDEKKEGENENGGGGGYDGTRLHDARLVNYSNLSGQRGTWSAEQLARRDLLGMEVSVGGSNLSGGFQQSLALARVFLRKRSQLVILDEAMGQMDALL